MAILAPHSDRAVQEYRHRSGARDTYWINELVKYVRSEGLYDSFRLYPFMPRTNADSGSTAFGLGGLTSNDMTLVNGPTWGASGLAFASASSQYGSISDFLGSETLTIFNRVSIDPAPPDAAIKRLYGLGDFGATDGSVALSYAGNTAGDPFRIARSSDGNTANAEFYDTTNETQTTADQCLVNQWIDGGARSMWQNKIPLTLTLFAGSNQTTRNDTQDPFIYSAQISNGSLLQPIDQTAHALAFVTGTLTTTQRETITDLINEL